VPRGDLRAHVARVAAEIVAGAPLSIQATKQVMLRSLAHGDIAQALAARYPAAEAMLASEDANEGQRAFVEKRLPRWSGK